MATTNNKKLRITNNISNSNTLPMVTQSHPWVVIYDSNKPETQISFSISEGRYYTRNVPELCNKVIFSHCMDWLVVANNYNDKSDGIYLFNVVSKEKLRLPESLRPFHVYSLTCLPEDPNCRIVCVNHLGLTVSLYQPGKNNNIITNKRIFLPEEVKDLSSAIFFDGSIYGVAHSSVSLIRGDLDDPTFEFRIVFDGKSVEKEIVDDNTSYHLTESCGELLLVTWYPLQRGNSVFQVLRADFSTSEWVFLRSIGDRAIFLDRFSSHGISCSASESGILGNCIYYTESNDKILYVFNLQDRSLTMTILSTPIASIRLMKYWVMIPHTSP